MSKVSNLSILLTTFLSLAAFAFNSILCRKALGEGEIDAAGFTLIRLASGMIMLYILLAANKKASRSSSRGNWISAFMLFLYAAAFSYAYLTLTTGTGALILFGTVQITMILFALVKGDGLHTFEWLGLLLASGGFIYLVLPGVSAPSYSGFFLMTAAGIGWGFYTLRGKKVDDPLAETCYNFLRTGPFIVLLLMFTYQNISLSPRGVLLAVISGALASGVGYSLWYHALKGLSTVAAAVLQLLVPILAALGGLVFVSEPVTLRLILAGALVLGGILLVILGRNK